MYFSLNAGDSTEPAPQWSCSCLRRSTSMTSTAPSTVSMYRSSITSHSFAIDVSSRFNLILLSSPCNDWRCLEPASFPLLCVLPPLYYLTNYYYLRWASLTFIFGILIFIDNYRYKESCTSDLAASFLRFRLFGGIPSRRLFLQLGTRVGYTPRCARLVLSLVSILYRKEKASLLFPTGSRDDQNNMPFSQSWNQLR